MLATYSGTKAFLVAFTTALAEEVKAHNIVVENLNTYFVVSYHYILLLLLPSLSFNFTQVSKLSKVRKSSILIPDPTTYVRSTLCKIGLACGAAFSGRPDTSTPYWSHSLLDYSMTVIGWKGLFIRRSHVLLLALRKRALKKMERERKEE
jgi:17beta-estradiol 17-dehydrogenase / very-long-chain 3-oxoacyl-CoA reductase